LKELWIIISIIYPILKNLLIQHLETFQPISQSLILSCLTNSGFFENFLKHQCPYIEDLEDVKIEANDNEALEETQTTSNEQILN
jgi:hypothetical protein